MPAGRCAGCGAIDASAKKIRVHVVTCSQYLELFKIDASRALPPEEEYIRWKEEEDTEDARAEAKDLRLQLRFADMDRRRENQKTRWAQPKDILEDD